MINVFFISHLFIIRDSIRISSTLIFTSENLFNSLLFLKECKIELIDSTAIFDSLSIIDFIASKNKFVFCSFSKIL